MVATAQSSEELPAKRFQLVGGELCLDFANTVGGKREGIPREYLHSYLHFLAWCEQAGLVKGKEVETLIAKASHSPRLAASTLRRVLELREAIYRILFALSKDEKPAPTDLGLLNSELGKSLCRLQISQENEQSIFQWVWCQEPLELESPLGPIAHSAANLLVSPSLVRQVHQCGGDNCGWLFLDCSKNHSRRWCDMRDCGNRAKVRRHRQKRGGEDSSSQTGEVAGV